VFSFCPHSLLQFISRQGLHCFNLAIACLYICPCSVLYSSKISCIGIRLRVIVVFTALEVNLGGCNDNRWTEVSVKWQWRIAENTDFCEQGVGKHLVSGNLWTCSGIEGQFIVNRTLETNMTQNMCTVIWFSKSRVRLR